MGPAEERASRDVLPPSIAALADINRDDGNLHLRLHGLRRFGLKALKIGEVRNQCRYWG
jgi:hypothetical protein